MILREDFEKREYEILSPFAAKAAESKGRQYEKKNVTYGRITSGIGTGSSTPKPFAD
jgi:hypothetical protein